MPNSENYKKKARKYRKEKGVIRIAKKDFEEQLIKYKGITDAQSTPVKDPMAHKDH